MVHALVLDDDPLYRTMIRSTLERSGQVAATAENATQCLALLDLMRFDVIVVDLLMPRGKAAELRAAIGACGRGVPVLGTVDGTERAATPGGWPVAAVVAKPFREEELLSALDQVLGAWR